MSNLSKVSPIFIYVAILAPLTPVLGKRVAPLLPAVAILATLLPASHQTQWVRRALDARPAAAYNDVVAPRPPRRCPWLPTLPPAMDGSDSRSHARRTGAC